MSKFTTKIRKRWLAEALNKDSTLDYAICAVIDLCDRLDASEASCEELVEALEHIRIIPRNFKSGMTYEKRMVRMIEIAEAAIEKAEK